MIGIDTWIIFGILFAVFVILGFYGRRWRKGNLNNISEWALAGRSLGTKLTFFLVGADLYTAYSFLAVPSAAFASGSLFYYVIPYLVMVYALGLVVMPKLWKISKEKGYITASDFVKDRFDSKTLSVLIALTGIVALLPYMALQIIGMQSVLTVMLSGYANSQSIEEIALIISFIALAAFTYTSGLRGATLTSIFKDILIWITVIAIVVAVSISLGGFGTAFKDLKPNYISLPNGLYPAYFSLALGSTLSLFLYPNIINGVLGAKNVQSVRTTISLLPLYGLGLAFLVLMGVLVYAVSPAMHFLSAFPASSRGILVIPTLIVTTMPSWFSGVALLGIFIGGLVPAAIMAMAQANLLARNVVKIIKPNLKENSEIRLTKWSSTIFKFVALGFVFLVPATYAISLQLLSVIILTQTLPAIFLGLFFKSLKKGSLIAGWAVGMFSGILMVEFINKFGLPVSSLVSTPIGPIYIAVVAVGINLAISVGGSIFQKNSIIR